MGVAQNALAWAACIVAIGLPVGILMAIKLQEDREAKAGATPEVLVDGESYVRRYRFLWASLPMSFLLLALVGIPLVSCHADGRCYSDRWSMLLLVVSLVSGLLAWSLTISLIYNRYFQSTATRPFRLVQGAEQRMLWMGRATALVAVVAMVTALLR